MSYNLKKPKRKANRRKAKKNLNSKITGLNLFPLRLHTTNKGPVLYSSCASKGASFGGTPKTSAYVPDTEVLDVAFPHEPSVSVKELYDSGAFSSLENPYEEKIDDEIIEPSDDEDFASLIAKAPSWLEED